jgi:hypothetical protein
MLVFSTIYESQYDRPRRAAIRAITTWQRIKLKRWKVFGVEGK